MPINERDIVWDWSDPAQLADLARYVQENLDDIAKIVKEAEDDLKQIPPWHDPSFDAYVSGDPDRVRAQIKALFQCLQKGKPKSGKYLTYRVEPPDSPKGKQRLRLAREVLHNGHSECMGWVLLLAACALHVRLNPLVIVTKNKRTGEVHAMLGYWLAEQCFPQVVVSGKDAESRLVHEIEVVNATRIAVDENGHTRSFEQAKKEAHERLLPPKNSDWEIMFAVDLQKAREEGIKPLLPLEPWSRNHSLPLAKHFQWRPELEDVYKWWQDENSYGVLALVGIDGAGKTALVHRFLAQLPNSDVKEESVDKDETLPIPDALFVWSFYQHPDADRCATELYNYLTKKQVPKATFEQIQEVLSENWRGCRVLLVFDSLERLQIARGTEPEEEGGTFGQFLPEGAPLARFLSWCCNGPRPVHVLITSCFGLTDLHESAGGYHAIDLKDLPLESARALLRACGVKGLDWQLDELIREFGNHEFGYHAQTLDLLGNALRIWCDGDPARTHELPSLEDVKKLAGLKDKVLRRVQVLRFYEEKLSSEALGVLQLLCTLHSPADFTILKGVLGGLSRLSQQDLKAQLIALEEEYRLIHSFTLLVHGSSMKVYTVHPSIKSYFYVMLPQAERRAVHSRISAYVTACIQKIRGDPDLPFEAVRQDIALRPELIRMSLQRALMFSSHEDRKSFLAAMVWYRDLPESQKAQYPGIKMALQDLLNALIELLQQDIIAKGSSEAYRRIAGLHREEWRVSAGEVIWLITSAEPNLRFLGRSARSYWGRGVPEELVAWVLGVHPEDFCHFWRGLPEREADRWGIELSYLLDSIVGWHPQSFVEMVFSRGSISDRARVPRSVRSDFSKCLNISISAKLVHARLAVDKGDLGEAERVIHEVLRIAKSPDYVGGAWHLLGETLLALAQSVGPGGHDAKDRSYAELLEEARQVAEGALALRQRIQDPKAEETQELLQRIQEMQDETL